MTASTQLHPAAHRYTDSANGPLHALDYGGDGSPLVCLHGVAGSAWGWHDVAVQLQPRRVVAVDMRGHGDSARSADGAYDTVDQVADLTQQIDALGAPTVALAGSSWGALVALEYCAANPDRVSQLALVDIEPSFDAADTDVPPRPREFDSTDQVAQWLGELNPRAPESAIEAMAHGAFTIDGAGRIIPKHDPVFFERWPFRNGDHWDALSHVQCPTLLVHAGFTFVRGEIMAKMQEAIPGSSLVEIAEAGHVIPVDNPVALADSLKMFLEA